MTTFLRHFLAELFLNKGGRESEAHKLPKMCVFGLKIRLFRQKKTKNSRLEKLEIGGHKCQEHGVRLIKFFTVDFFEIGTGYYVDSESKSSKSGIRVLRKSSFSHFSS